MKKLAIIGLSFSLLVTGCGEDKKSGTTFTCDVPGSKACTSYSGDGADEYEENCEAGSGVWSTDDCSEGADLCGVCSFSDGSIDYMNFYYTGGPMDKPTIENMCANLSGTWTDQPGIACD